MEYRVHASTKRSEDRCGGRSKELGRMFQNAQHTDAQGSTFNDVGRDQINVDRVAIGQIVNYNSAGAM